MVRGQGEDVGAEEARPWTGLLHRPGHISAVEGEEGFEGLGLGLRPPRKVPSQMGRLAMEEG